MPYRNLKRDAQTFTNMVTSANSVAVPLVAGASGEYAKGYSVMLGITVNTPAAGVFTAVAATDLMTLAAHDFTTGLKVQVSNSGGALPTGLSAATDYFVVVISSSTFKLATSYANATATVPTVIDLTTAGTGTQTVTPAALAGATYKIQVASIEQQNWVDLAAAASITASTTVLVEKLDPMYDVVRLVYVMTAGRMTIVENIVVKGE